MKAVIIAAGMGGRLWTTTDRRPKTLLPFGQGTILSTIIMNIASIGIQDFVIVVGYEKASIMTYIEGQQHFGLNITIVENPAWQQGNGISVLTADQTVGTEPFLLSMSDHIVPVSALRRIAGYASPHHVLLVDPKVDEIFDIDDATKVQVVQKRIVHIGKAISQYNGIDCGIFRLKHSFFEVMRQQLQQHRDSLSAAVAGLSDNHDMEAVFMQADEAWIDIDTPQAYRFALEMGVQPVSGRNNVRESL